MTTATLDWSELRAAAPARGSVGRPRARRPDARPPTGRATRVAVVPVPARAVTVCAPAGTAVPRLPGAPVATARALPELLPASRPAVRPAPVAVAVTMPAAASVRVAERRPARPRVRLTQRGRLAVTLLLTGVLYVAVTTAVSAVTAAGPAVDHEVTVSQGQSLSEIAAAELPSLPVRQAITELQLANDLSGTQLLAGQTLVVPRVR